MGRRAKIPDSQLADRLRRHIEAHRLSLTDVGSVLKVDKATISRSLKGNAFSAALYPRVVALVDSEREGQTVEELLQKSLQLLHESDKLRASAERMIAQALDRSGISA